MHSLNALIQGRPPDKKKFLVPKYFENKKSTNQIMMY